MGGGAQALHGGIPFSEKNRGELPWPLSRSVNILDSFFLVRFRVRAVVLADHGLSLSQGGISVRVSVFSITWRVSVPSYFSDRITQPASPRFFPFLSEPPRSIS